MVDVSGRRLRDALMILKSQGFDKIAVRLTAPPGQRDKGYSADSRVIRQVLTENSTVELLVCNTDN